MSLENSFNKIRRNAGIKKCVLIDGNVGDVYLTYSPSNTNTVKYIRVSDSDWVCGANCTAGTTHKYKKYTRTATPITKYQCTKYETQSVPIKTTVQYVTGYEKKIVSKEPVYKKVTTTYGFVTSSNNDVNSHLLCCFKIFLI